ncbi:MAG: hypothetical protein AB7V77_03000 [Candidatus Woesearchaeota archaeon]
MLNNLSYDYNLRGYVFEYVARILLRRLNNNNFIFQLSRFDSIDEILTKYKLEISPKVMDLILILKKEWNKCDLIEFKLNNKEQRKIEQILMYDVKTKYYAVERKYFEFCESNFKFMKKCVEMKVPTKIISMILFEDWRFSFNISDFENAPKKIYSNFKNKN